MNLYNLIKCLLFNHVLAQAVQCILLSNTTTRINEGFERCCDGDQQAQFKAPSSSVFTTFSSTDGLNAVAAVPEPETYAMLLAGLGLIGFTASRRKLVNK